MFPNHQITCECFWYNRWDQTSERIFPPITQDTSFPSDVSVYPELVLIDWIICHQPLSFPIRETSRQKRTEYFTNVWVQYFFSICSVFFNVFQYFPIFVSIFSRNRANFRLLTFECSEAICIGSNVQLCKTLRRSKESKSLQLSSFITLYSRNRDRHQTIKDSWVHKLLFKSIFSSSKAIWDIVYFLLYCQLGRKKSCLFNFESIA